MLGGLPVPQHGVLPSHPICATGSTGGEHLLVKVQDGTAEVVNVVARLSLSSESLVRVEG